MGMFTSVDGEVRIVSAPFLSLALVPVFVAVDKKGLDQVARFDVHLTWEPGYEKPVYLMVAGLSEGVFKFNGDSIMDPTGQYGIVPNGTTFVQLEIDMAGVEIPIPAGQEYASVPFAVGAYEDEPIPQQ